MKPKENELRIVCDGHRFKIQQYVKCPFWIPLLLPRGLWSDLGDLSQRGYFMPNFYETFEEARQVLMARRTYQHKEHDWAEVPVWPRSEPTIQRPRIKADDYTVTILGGGLTKGQEFGFNLPDYAEIFMNALKENGIEFSLFVEMAGKSADECKQMRLQNLPNCVPPTIRREGE